MWLPLIGLLLGILLGLLTNYTIPAEYTSYFSIAVLAAFDTLFGGIRAYLDHTFNETVFVTGFFFNIILAAGLAFLGAQIAVDLYLAAVFAFGIRLFNNIAIIRRILLEKWMTSREGKTNKES